MRASNAIAANRRPNLPQRKHPSMEVRRRRATAIRSLRPWRVRHGQVDGDRLPRTPFESQAPIAVEGERELAVEQPAHRLTQQLAPPAFPQPVVRTPGEE